MRKEPSNILSNHGIETPNYRIFRSQNGANIDITVCKQKNEDEDYPDSADEQSEYKKTWSAIFTLEPDENFNFSYRPKEIYTSKSKQLILACEYDFTHLKPELFEQTKQGYACCFQDPDYLQDLKQAQTTPNEHIEKSARKRTLLTLEEMLAIIEQQHKDPRAIPTYIVEKAFEQTGTEKEFAKAARHIKWAIIQWKSTHSYSTLNPEEQAGYDSLIKTHAEKLREKTYTKNKQRVWQSIKNFAYLLKTGQDIPWKEIRERIV